MTMADELSAGMRRLPVYMVLDCSGSMSGEPIEAVRMGLRALISDLQGDPQALETAWLSVITFESTAKQVVPLTELALVQEPPIIAGGGTSLGAALKLLTDCINKEVRKTTKNQKGDWKPLIFLMTDGQPTDSWQGPADDLKKLKPGNIIACAAGPHADDAILKRITEVVVRLQDTSSGTLGTFMKWVSDSISTTSASVSAQGDAAVNLPALPEGKGIQIVP
jgi:uncharacterized protein YegL